MSEAKPGTFWHFLHTVKRSPGNGLIAGICTGLEKASPAPAWVWRALFLVSIVFGFMGPILYVVLWIVMPVEDAQPEPDAQE